MKKVLFPLCFLFFHTLIAQPQNGDCYGPIATEVIHGNNIRTIIKNAGDLFWDAGGGDGRFQVNYQDEQTPSSIFLAGLMMGGLDPGGNLKLAAQFYGTAQGEYDYSTGPLDASTGTTNLATCTQYDRIWSVRRYEIEAHLADLADNGVLDQPFSSILAWPAIGNPHFESIHGFELPDGQEMAPFHDSNQDGLYQPENGDYPLPTNVHPSVIPEHTLWTVFNDAGNIHSQSNADPIQAEIQLTTWALNCTDNPVLNNTIFTSHKIINRAAETIDSFHVGLFVDFDLGCYTDDFMGSNPTNNSFFVYNSDEVDGTIDSDCPHGVTTYSDAPPTQAITLLNRNLHAFISFNNPAIGNPPTGTTFPSTVSEFYNYLTGTWRDGSPITVGGNGYMTGEPTNFAFPDSPNAPDGWSMLTAVDDGLNGDLDMNTVNSTNIGTLEPQEAITVEYAYSFHQDINGTHLTNVDKMYAEVPQLQAMYDNQFLNHCEQVAVCEEDCIWAGDANADGIANHCDLLPMAVALGQTGPTRIPPYAWSPFDGEAWADNFPQGGNYKHIDANGNGVVEQSDFDLTINHYGFTTPFYEANNVYENGPELFFTPAGTTEIDAFNDGAARLKLNLETTEPIYGLALTIEYDTDYISSMTPIPSSGAWTHTQRRMGELDFAVSQTDGTSILESEDILTLLVGVVSEFNEPLPSASTTIRIKNIKAVKNDGTPLDIGATELEVTFIDVPTSTTEVSASPFQIYPNPTSGDIKIQADQIVLEEILLIDVTGQILQQHSFNNFDYQLSMKDLPKGIYFVKLFSKGKGWVEKVVKQ